MLTLRHCLSEVQIHLGVLCLSYSLTRAGSLGTESSAVMISKQDCQRSSLLKGSFRTEVFLFSKLNNVITLRRTDISISWKNNKSPWSCPICRHQNSPWKYLYQSSLLKSMVYFFEGILKSRAPKHPKEPQKYHVAPLCHVDLSLS